MGKHQRVETAATSCSFQVFPTGSQQHLQRAQERINAMT
jgi:hypothetical protein